MKYIMNNAKLRELFSRVVVLMLPLQRELRDAKAAIDILKKAMSILND